MPFTFHEGFPKEAAFTFDRGIFHDVKHLKLQASTGWHSFYLLNDKTVECIFYVHFENGHASSPYRSPFGSFLFSPSVTVDLLKKFISFCEHAIQKLKATELLIKNSPEVYTGNSKVLTQALSDSGYAALREETSAVIPVTTHSFEAGLHKSEKKRLRKCRESKLSFELVPIGQLQKVYIFLEACRKEKGYALSMPFDDLKKLAETFPERVVLTAVMDGQKYAAANVSIRVYDHVLYNFYHDHASEYDSLSPVVLLNEGLYNFCQQRNISQLDLGTSNVDGALNESLFNFKLKLGAIPSRKLTFSKPLV